MYNAGFFRTAKKKPQQIKQKNRKNRKNEIPILIDTIPGRDGCLHLEQNLFTE